MTHTEIKDVAALMDNISRHVDLMLEQAEFVCQEIAEMSSYLVQKQLEATTQDNERTH